jgi:hypothetical protein
MFGVILVEPSEGLPPVDREICVIQNELYLEKDPDPDDDGTELILNYDAAGKENPSHFMFNGKVGGQGFDKPIMVNADERIRIFMGNAGPNSVSSFHIVGTIFDKVYRDGDLVSPPQRCVQTVLVPAGGATCLEIVMQVPGSYAILDHSIFRIDKGAVATIKVKGTPRPDIYDSLEPPVYCPGCKTHQ